MSLLIDKSPLFHADVTSQFRYYANESGHELAWKFFNTVDMTLFKLAAQPDMGRLRHFRGPAFRELRSFRVEPPFYRLLIFYRSTESVLQVWRLMHGSRDLPRRLVELPD
jgi:toxin ParE1/3/4